MPPTFLIVDGHSMAFRAYYALPDTIRTPTGEPVQVVYGFLTILFKQISELQPDLVSIVFDRGNSFRDDLFTAYKAGRQEIDPEVQRQVELLMELLNALEMPIYSVEGYEADDVIATLVRQVADEELYTVVLSGDRDLFGVIDQRTVVLYPRRSMGEAEYYDEDRLRGRWGIRPDQVADFKAMVGDPSDNIPGVRGIGEKGAAKLLQQFGDLNTIYSNLDLVTPKRAREALTRGKEMAYLSLKLTRLIDDVPGVLFRRAMCELAYDREQVLQLFDQFGFNRLRERLP